MGNPIFDAYQNNFFSLLDRFNQFKAQFQGDPKQQVEQLMRSGQMTKEQYDYLSGMAQRFQGMMNTRR